MEPQSVSVIFILGIIGLAGMANGLCLVRNTTMPNQYWYQCIRSTDYLADMNRSPIDVYGHTVSNSKIRVIRNESYARLSKSLQSLGVIYCGVEEIEDNAFHGLSHLRDLGFTGNKLEIIKSAWFKGLSSLNMVSFKNNRIKHVEDDFFTILPPLNVLDISNNQLTCLPTTSISNFNASKFLFRDNRLTWLCQASILEWLKRTDVWTDHLDQGKMDPPYEITKACVSKHSGTRLDEGFMKRCAVETARQLLPARGDYTVAQVCQFLQGKNSPFLDCTK